MARTFSFSGVTINGTRIMSNRVRRVGTESGVRFVINRHTTAVPQPGFDSETQSVSATVTIEFDDGETRVFESGTRFGGIQLDRFGQERPTSEYSISMKQTDGNGNVVPDARAARVTVTVQSGAEPVTLNGFVELF